MKAKRIIGTFKAGLENLRFMRAWRKAQPQSRAAVTSDQVAAAYERLQTAIADESLRKDIDTLKATADSGQRLSWFGRRFAFGFGVAKAIEDWFQAFDMADPEQALLERIPRNETSNVAAKWLWFGFFTTLLGVFFSLLVAGVTAYFLYMQTVVLAEQAENTRATNTNAQRTQYAQILYDEKCELEPVELTTDSAKNKPKDAEMTCIPVNNKRIRAEAAIAFLKLEPLDNEEPDLAGAHLANTDLSGIDLGDVNLWGANLRKANLSDTNLSGANLRKANLSDTNLSGADLRKANLSDTNLSDTNLSDTNLSGANLRKANLTGTILIGADLSGAGLIRARLMDTNLSGANLSGAYINFVSANLSGAGRTGACGDEDTKLPDGYVVKNCSGK